MTKNELNLIINGVIEGLQEKKLIKQELDPYKKVELMLYNYNRFKNRIELNEKAIVRLGKPKGIGSQSFDNEGVTSKEAMINELESANFKMQLIIDKIDIALEDIKTDINYPIIQYKYFEDKTDDAIAEIMHKERSVITKQKKKLIDDICAIIFIEDVVAKMA